MVNLLDGVRILDFTHIHAGPLCTYQLALMGASVLKVESPHGGDQMRSMGFQYSPGMSGSFIGQNANKRSIAIDLKSDDGLKIVRQLLKSTDAVVINMRPGTAAQLGIGYQECCEVASNIVYCAISGYGQEGPESDRPAMDHLMQGESGIFISTGTEEQPVRVGFSVSDSCTALVASSAVVAALHRRSKTDEGAYIDVSMLESSMTLMGLNWYNFLASGQVGRRTGVNARSPAGSAGTWECSEGTILVNANSHRNFERMAKALGLSELVDDPRFSSQHGIQENGTVLREIFAGVFATNTSQHWDAVLRAAGVPSGQLKTLDQVVRHPQLAHRRSLKSLSGVPGVDTSIQFLGAGFLVDSEPTTPTSPPPTLGQHTDEVLHELGLDRAEIDSLRSGGVVA